ncbi:MAG: hypothetical protein KAS39_03970, partial [Actinomycetia bacterium]|nr:hypothetical protein [Actinomycetes bacterium]
LITFFSLFLFYTVVTFYEEEKELFYIALLPLTIFVTLFLKRIGIQNEYYAFSLVVLSLIWLLGARAVRGVKNLEILELIKEPLAYSSYILSGLVSVIYLFSTILDTIGGRNIISINVLTFLTVSLFYALATFYQKEDLFFYPSLFFLATTFYYLYDWLNFPKGYLALAFTLFGFSWLITEFMLKRNNYKELVWNSLRYSSYSLVMFAAILFLSSFLISLVSGGDYTTTSNVLSFLIISLFFGVSAFIDDEAGIFMYLSLGFFTGFFQLLFLQIGIEVKYIAIPVSFLTFFYLFGMFAVNEKRYKDIRAAFLYSTYPVSLYSMLIGLFYQPTFIAVLLLNAFFYIVLASFSKDYQINLWAGFSLMTLALFVALNYYQISHLFSNILYIALYLSMFSVALALREVKLEMAKKWAVEYFNFSIVFCSLQLLLQVFGAINFSTIYPHSVPFWMFEGVNGFNVLMLAFIVAGFFYINASQLFKQEIVIYLGYFFFLAAYLTKIIDLNVNFIEWYSLPIGIYLISMGYYYLKKNPGTELIQFSNLTGILIVCGSSTYSYMVTPEAPAMQLHALYAALTAIIFLLIGVLLRVKTFFFGGIIFLTWNAVYQSWEFVYALPKWVTIGGVGLILIISGIYLEIRRDYFIELSKNLKKSFIEDWE